MVSCCVCDCTTTHKKNPGNYSWHSFPKDLDLRKKWLLAIDRNNWKPQKHSKVCGRHFEEECFQKKTRRNSLKDDSVPTLFVPVQVRERRPTSYVNRPGTSGSLPIEPTPGISNTVISPRQKNLVTRLKEKIAAKNKTIRKLKVRAKRMSKRILTLKEVVKELKKRPGVLWFEGSNTLLDDA